MNNLLHWLRNELQNTIYLIGQIAVIYYARNTYTHKTEMHCNKIGMVAKLDLTS